MRPNTKCVVDGTPVYRKPWEIRTRRAFCTHACYAKSRRKEKKCPACGAILLAHEKRKSCSRACANRLRAGIKYRQGRPNDRVTTIRILKAELIELRGPHCERCPYSKIRILIVHHKDRNPKNNALENLEILCPNCHAEEHYGGPDMGASGGFENRDRVKAVGGSSPSPSAKESDSTDRPEQETSNQSPSGGSGGASP